VAIGSAAGPARPPSPGTTPDTSRWSPGGGGLSAGARRYPWSSALAFAVAFGRDLAGSETGADDTAPQLV